MEFSKHELSILITAVDHYKWYNTLLDEERADWLEVKRKLQKLYKQATKQNGKGGDKK